MKTPSSIDISQWHYMLENKIENIEVDNIALKNVFIRSINNLKDDSLSSRVFITDIFHSVIGLNLLKITLSKEDKTVIENFINECWTGKGYTPLKMNSPLTAIMKTMRVPEDIYSTYYGLVVLLLLEIDIGSRLSDIWSTLSHHFQNNGWIYNSKWSETKIERRFDIELIQQALLATKIATLLKLDLKSLKFSSIREINLLNYIDKPRYVTACYYAIQYFNLLKLLETHIKCRIDNISNFIISHYSSNECGFREYQFENVKCFNYRGMDKTTDGASAKHRYQSDFLCASINATTYALYIGSLFPGSKIHSFLRSIKNELFKFYKKCELFTNGYGSPIKIAKYECNFGPRGTCVETCNYIIGLSLLNNL